MLGKILRVNNLRKRHLIVIDWCCLCNRSGEIVDHLFLSLAGLWSLNCLVSVGYAEKHPRAIGLLARAFWMTLTFRNMKGRPLLFYVVSLVWKECS